MVVNGGRSSIPPSGFPSPLSRFSTPEREAGLIEGRSTILQYSTSKRVSLFASLIFMHPNRWDMAYGLGQEPFQH
jgi:hypothetical protein